MVPVCQRDLLMKALLDLTPSAFLLPWQCNQAQQKLHEMASKYQVSHEEWEQLQEELRLCKEEIERLNGTIPTGGRVISLSGQVGDPGVLAGVQWYICLLVHESP